MTAKIMVRYKGPGMAVLAGKAIWEGETRECSPAQLGEARRHHPNDFVIVGADDSGAQLISGVLEEGLLGVEGEIEDIEAIKDQLAEIRLKQDAGGDLSALTVDQIKDVAGSTNDANYLRSLLEIEQRSDKPRKTAIAALEGRVAELENEPE